MLASYPRNAWSEPRPASATLASPSVSSSRAIGGLAILIVVQEVAMGPDEELLGVVVHSGLVLGRSKDVVVAIRRITAFPGGLALDTVVLARDIHAEAAGRREQAASAHRRAAEMAQREGKAAAEHDHTLQQAMIERRYLPSFDEGDRLRLGVTT